MEEYISIRSQLERLAVRNRTMSPNDDIEREMKEALQKYGDRSQFVLEIMLHCSYVALSETKQYEGTRQDDPMLMKAITALIVAAETYDEKSCVSVVTYVRDVIRFNLKFASDMKNLDAKAFKLLFTSVIYGPVSLYEMRGYLKGIGEDNEDLLDSVRRRMSYILETRSFEGVGRRVLSKRRMGVTAGEINEINPKSEYEYETDEELERTINAKMFEFDDATAWMKKQMGASGESVDFSPMKEIYRAYLYGGSAYEISRETGMRDELVDYNIRSAQSIVSRYRMSFAEDGSRNEEIEDETRSMGRNARQLKSFGAVKAHDENGVTTYVFGGSVQKSAEFASTFDPTAYENTYRNVPRWSNYKISKIYEIARFSDRKKKLKTAWHSAPFYGHFYSEWNRYHKVPDKWNRNEIAANIILSRIDPNHPYSKRKTDVSAG